MIETILTFIAGGGVSEFITLFTIGATRKKADEEAEAAEIANAEHIIRMQAEHIVEPLKKEVNALRKEVRKLQRAIDAIRECPHADHCPVRERMQDSGEG